MREGQQQQQQQNETKTFHHRDLTIEVTLSRPAYRLGTTVVGLIRVTRRDKNKTQNATTTSLRDAVQSLHLVMMGHVRFDERWHGKVVAVSNYYYDNDDDNDNDDSSSSNNNNNGYEVVDEDDPTTTTNNNNNNNTGFPYRAAAAAVVAPPNSQTIWSSNCIDLISLPERPYGRWERPPPIILSGQQQRQQRQMELQQRTTTTTTTTTTVSLEQHQLAFTFRVNLPLNRPPTLICTSCRYFYHLVLRLQLCHNHHNSKKKKQNTAAAATTVGYENDNDHDDEADNNNNNNNNNSVCWIQVPVRILTAEPVVSSSIPTYPFSTTTAAAAETQTHQTQQQQQHALTAMAHSNGLSLSPPQQLTATELLQLQGRGGGRLQVHQLHSACHGRHIRRHWPGSIQSMRVTDPHTSRPACFLTCQGANLLHPGARLVLKLEFPQRQRQQQNDVHDDEWIPVWQVSACLQGEEICIAQQQQQQQAAGGDGTKMKKRTRASSFLFDTAFVEMDPASTESISLSLLLPWNAPCTVQTPHVEINVRCLVDIVVSDETSTSTRNSKLSATAAAASYTSEPISYKNLRLEIPCQVVHAAAAWEEKEDSPSSDVMLLSSHYQHHQQQQQQQDNNHVCFETADIEPELKILSLHLADQCHLLPQTPYQEKRMIHNNGTANGR